MSRKPAKAKAKPARRTRAKPKPVRQQRREALAAIEEARNKALADAEQRVQALGDEAEQKLLLLIRQELKMKVGMASPYINALRLALERSGRMAKAKAVTLKQEKGENGETTVRVVWDQAPHAADDDEDG